MAISEENPDGKYEQPSHNKEKDGSECQGMEEMIKRWEEWTKENFSKEQDELKPQISCIPEPEWEKTSSNPQKTFGKFEKAHR